MPNRLRNSTNKEGQVLEIKSADPKYGIGEIRSAIFSILHGEKYHLSIID